MPSLPIELYSEIAQYLDRSDLAALSASTKIFHALATPMLYRDIAIHRSSSVEQLTKLLQTLVDRAADITLLVQRLELDWNTADFSARPSIALMLHVGLLRMSALTYLVINASLCTLDGVTMPALREFHLAYWTELDRGFLARHPHLKRLSLGGWHGGLRQFRDPMPQGLEYLRMSSAPFALAFLKRLPHGKDAKLARIDLGVSHGREQLEGARSEILKLLHDSFPTVSQVSVFGKYARNVLEHTRATGTRGSHVTRVGVPGYGYARDHDLRGIFVDVARVFPSVRTLDLLGREDGFHIQLLSNDEIARIVQGIEGLDHVDLVIFPHGKAYSRSGNDGFELLPTHVDDYPQIFWPNL
ncbi:hypothetical protein EXIGLDRAFT_749721 [Exidia glandulosa HHB12029]|uniref:F-box domain-containing protein n=1 Tax=Exidia glandulosa HHB12029 TaxID=1314781 RepID=A0A165HQM1_EXIGL|nr:hypothetical protein EXIGLDRAFT_749721 [Exidia glandulosa HHB12029]